MIKIKTLLYDDIDDFKINIKFESSKNCSSLEIWGANDMFKDFAKKLMDFPFGQSKTVKFEWGKDDDKWAYYLLVSVDVVDPAGKTVIKILTDNKAKDSNHYRCVFPIETEVAVINELGKQLVKWTPIENETWNFPN